MLVTVKKKHIIIWALVFLLASFLWALPGLLDDEIRDPSDREAQEHLYDPGY